MPNDYLAFGYGLHNPLVDGLVLARQIVEETLPEEVWDENVEFNPDSEDEDQCVQFKKVWNQEREDALKEIDKRVEEAKRVRFQ